MDYNEGWSGFQGDVAELEHDGWTGDWAVHVPLPLPAKVESSVHAVDFTAWDHSAPAKREKTRRKRSQWSAGKTASTANLYLSDIQKTIAGRHPKGGGPIDDCRQYFDPAMNLLAARYVAMKEAGRNPKPISAHAWATKWTPRLAAEKPRAWFDDVQRQALAAYDGNALLPRLRSADELADMIGSTAAERITFKLCAIGSIDRRARQRDAEDKAKRKNRERKRRRDAGAIPHTESMAAQKPWEAYDVSERTFRRWVKDNKVPPHPSQDKARGQKVGS